MNLSKPESPPMIRNLQSYGLQDKADVILLNKNEIDFRETIREIVEDYPSVRNQEAVYIQSLVNYKELINSRMHGNKP